jgi:hypothetical protein
MQQQVQHCMQPLELPNARKLSRTLLSLPAVLAAAEPLVLPGSACAGGAAAGP